VAQSAKPLFQATKPKPKVDPRQSSLASFPKAKKPEAEGRDPLDFDPTPPEPTQAFLNVEIDRILAHGFEVWENAVGAGHIARELQSVGLDVVGSDVVDRGWPKTRLEDFLQTTKAAAPIVITNPPYNLINARDGKGDWLRHTLDLGVTYAAFLLNWDWPLADGHADLLQRYPISRAYGLCWKVDFRGGGAPPQRNGWFVWDANHTGPTEFHRLRKGDLRQGALF